MNIGSAARFSIATLSLALLYPQLALGQNSPAQAGTDVAIKMVPGRAAVLKDLDANKLKAGQQFKVKLADTVHFQNGISLPHGTVLLGVVSSDNLLSGNSKLALRFTTAELKSGKTIPISVTIVGVAAPEYENGEGYDIAAGDQQPNNWTPGTLQVDQINALSGVDLHSRIAGQNSGVFVTTKKDDVKLDKGSELLLAIGPQRG
jgi:hypothetical protein